MNIAIIGSGKMGESLLRGIISSKVASHDEIIITDILDVQLQKLQTELGVNITTDNSSAVKDADIVILAVKPIHLKVVLSGISDSLKESAILISIAAGVSIDEILLYTKDKPQLQVVRAMPNTPAFVLKGATGICYSDRCHTQTKKLVQEIFEGIGIVQEFTEPQLAAVTGVSGSGPAFVAIFIEAMSDAAVLMGMTRSDALKFVIQTTEGTAKLIADSGLSPSEVKEAVSSPGGTTIAGIAALEEAGFRHAVIAAVKAASIKAKGDK